MEIIPKVKPNKSKMQYGGVKSLFNAFLVILTTQYNPENNYPSCIIPFCLRCVTVIIFNWPDNSVNIYLLLVHKPNRQNCREKAVWRSVFCVYSIAFWMLTQQKLTPPVLLFTDFARETRVTLPLTTKYFPYFQVAY